MSKGLQPSLSAGELSPGLHGRVDIARYAIALKKCRNMVVRQTGGAGKRTGYIYRGKVKTGTLAGRILPFIYSTDVRYIIEAGNLYFRFWYMDADNRLVRLEVAGVPVEVVTPYTTADLEKLRITQSADVLFIAGVNGATKIPPKELRRVAADTFELSDHEYRLGPFRALNNKEANKIAVSAATGNVNVTSNAALFSADMVGSLLLLEEKELRSIKPWEPLERNVPVGSMRRSDGKVYRATAVAPAAAGGTPYNITGNTRPIHEVGRAWDGPGDARNDGVNGYSVGVEWEYVNAGYGIVKLTGFTNANAMTGVVVMRTPQSIIGVAAAPGGTSTLSGDGVTMSFAIFDAQSTAPTDYEVKINGVPVSSNPYQYPPPGSGGGGRYGDWNGVGDIP